MPSSCVVGGCTLRAGQTSKRPGRQFLIMNKAPEDGQMRQKWDKRADRQPGHVCESKMKAYSVCSDLFHDPDYERSSFSEMKILGYDKKRDYGCHQQQKVPNTDPERDELQLYLNGEVHIGEWTASTATWNKRARVTRRVL